MDKSAERQRDSKGRFIPIHNCRHHPLYKVWCGMKERCNNPHNKSYSRYGARGITVCDEWQGFEAFYKWSLANGWHQGLTIDRIDNNKGYSPSNCRFVTYYVQNRNYSRNHNITYHGETHCIKDWEAITGIKAATILYRIQANKCLDDVFDIEDGRRKRWQKI